jgi:hypothetical protein
MPATVKVMNLLQGPAVLYFGAFGATEPATLAEEPSSEFWTFAGGTTDGLNLKISTEYSPLVVDQLLENAGATATERIATAATNLAEVTLENFARLLNEQAPVTTAGEKVFEPTTGFAAFEPIYNALLWDGRAPGGGRRRCILRRTLATSGIDTSQKKDEQQVLPAEWEAYGVSNLVKPWRIIDAAAA